MCVSGAVSVPGLVAGVRQATGASPSPGIARTEAVNVPGPAGRLGGTLTVPATAVGAVPAVVTLTGSGAHFRDGNRTPGGAYRPFKEIAERLATCGIATLRLDDRGVGESDGHANAATATDTAADAEAALRYLRTRPGIDAVRLGGVGHSYGAEIAPMVAAADPSVGAVVLLGAPARSFRETMRYQWQYRIAHDPAIAPDEKDNALADAMRQQDVNVRMSTEAWRQSIQDLDPLPVARKLGMPVLILHGLTDRAVDPDDARLLERAIRESGNSRVELHFFTGVNHHFQDDPIGATDGYAQLPTQALTPAVLDTLCLWFRKVWP
jgi:hypothetical protein